MRRTSTFQSLRPVRSSAVGRLLSAALLAIALSLAQQHAVLHWLSHALSQAAASDKLAPVGAQHCADCDAVASFGAAAPAAPGPVVAPADGIESHGVGNRSVAPATAGWLAYRSRAPPAHALT